MRLTLSIRLALAIACLQVVVPTQAAPQLMQGPMLGHVTTDSAKVWARVGGEAEFSVLYGERSDFSDAIETPSVRATPKNDFCVEITLTDLKPNAYYYYQALVDGQPLSALREREGYPFLTAPDDNTLVEFSIGFGSGAKAEADGLQAIWLQVQNARPHAFLWLGDNESAEGLAPAFQAEQYRKQRNVPFLQPLLRSIPQMSTWDGQLGGADSKSLEIFKRYWANPGYGTKKAPGAYFKYSYGGVDFFMLDTYTYRSREKNATLLGKAQLAWLKSELAASAAKFKVLLSSSSWTDLRENNLSTWTAFPEERSELLAHIRDRRIDGVVLVSGDNDQAEIKAIPMSETGGYDLYELVSSPLAQDPRLSSDSIEASTIEIQAPYAQAMNFGLLSFDMTTEDPSFRFEIINIFGESVFPALQVKSSELTNGVASWKSKVDGPEAYSYLPEGNSSSVAATN